VTREIRLNAFEMNCITHQSPGLWRHPRDRAWQYKDLDYWTDLARILEGGKFDASSSPTSSASMTSSMVMSTPR
jgi:long-chain alkane monooxygenase